MYSINYEDSDLASMLSDKSLQFLVFLEWFNYNAELFSIK